MLKIGVFLKKKNYNKLPLDGSQKTFHETVAWHAGRLQACLVYPGRTREGVQSIHEPHKLTSRAS